MKWTTNKLKELARRYPHENNRVLAAEFGCSPKALAHRAHLIGVKKTEAARGACWGGRGDIPGERRHIATGTLVTHGRTITHLSNCSLARE